MGVTQRVCKEVSPSNECRRLDALNGWIGNRWEYLASILSLLVVLQSVNNTASPILAYSTCTHVKGAQVDHYASCILVRAEKCALLYEPDFMSSEESDVDGGDEVLVVQSLPWHSNAAA